MARLMEDGLGKSEGGMVFLGDVCSLFDHFLLESGM
jgi:hypothetical protein